MRSAREVFQAAMLDGDRRADMPPESLVGCSDTTDWHSSYCDAGTAAIEADRAVRDAEHKAALAAARRLVGDWMRSHPHDPLSAASARAVTGARFEYPEATPPTSDQRAYPCAACGVMRSASEGGTVFTVCDACWHDTVPSASATTEGPRGETKETG